MGKLLGPDGAPVEDEHQQQIKAIKKDGLIYLVFEKPTSSIGLTYQNALILGHNLEGMVIQEIVSVIPQPPADENVPN